MKKTIFILKPMKNGNDPSWHEIEEKELKEWLKDGIEPDDLIIYPHNVKRVCTDIKLVLIDENIHS